RIFGEWSLCDSQIEPSIRSNCDVERNQTALGRAVPNIDQLVADAAQGSDELIPIKDALRSKVRTLVLQSDKSRPVVEGEAVDHKMLRQLLQAPQHVPEILDILDGARGEQEIVGAGVREVRCEADAGPPFSRDLPAGLHDVGQIANCPPKFGREVEPS